MIYIIFISKAMMGLTCRDKEAESPQSDRPGSRWWQSSIFSALILMFSMPLSALGNMEQSCQTGVIYIQSVGRGMLYLSCGAEQWINSWMVFRMIFSSLRQPPALNVPERNVLWNSFLLVSVSDYLNWWCLCFYNIGGMPNSIVRLYFKWRLLW